MELVKPTGWLYLSLSGLDPRYVFLQFCFGLLIHSQMLFVAFLLCPKLAIFRALN